MPTLYIADTNECLFAVRRVVAGEEFGRGPYWQAAPFDGYALRTSHTPVYQWRFVRESDFEAIKASLIVDTGIPKNITGKSPSHAFQYLSRRLRSWVFPGLRYELRCRIHCREGLVLLLKNFGHQATRYYGGGNSHRITHLRASCRCFIEEFSGQVVPCSPKAEFAVTVLPYQLAGAIQMIKSILAYHAEHYQCDGQLVDMGVVKVNRPMITALKTTNQPNNTDVLR